jgi:hypothetical protein
MKITYGSLSAIPFCIFFEIRENRRKQFFDFLQTLLITLLVFFCSKIVKI